MSRPQIEATRGHGIFGVSWCGVSLKWRPSKLERKLLQSSNTFWHSPVDIEVGSVTDIKNAIFDGCSTVRQGCTLKYENVWSFTPLGPPFSSNCKNMRKMQIFAHIFANHLFFFNIVQTAFDPPSPPRFWTFMLRIFLKGYWKSA